MGAPIIAVPFQPTDNSKTDRAGAEHSQSHVDRLENMGEEGDDFARSKHHRARAIFSELNDGEEGHIGCGVKKMRSSVPV